MIIDNKTITKLEKLSSLNIEDDKKEALKEELGQIVTFIENLNDIDVPNINATFTTIDTPQPLRADKVTTNENLSKHILQNAPKTQDNYFIVPPIIE